MNGASASQGLGISGGGGQARQRRGDDNDDVLLFVTDGLASQQSTPRSSSPDQ